MKETPIIMSGNHPKLILDGIKTQTRRVIKPQFRDWQGHNWYGKANGYHLQFNDSTLEEIKKQCPYGQVGDRLWVRETWWQDQDGDTFYKVDWQRPDGSFTTPRNSKWKPSIHMPRWASRITLEITEVRVERVQEITEEDAEAEGVSWSPIGSGENPEIISAVENFAGLWDSLNAKRGYSWEVNPWVWVISFKLITQ